MRDPIVQYAMLAWVASEVVLNVIKRRRGAASQDRGSLLLLFGGFTVISWLSFQLAANRVAPNDVSPWIGIAVFAAGVILRLWSIITLGQFFTVNVSIANDHQLVRRGPYRCLRHPSYTGIWLITTGLGLAMRDWSSFAAMTILPLLPLAYRIAVEERALSDRFGAEWDQYRKETRRLLPWIY